MDTNWCLTCGCHIDNESPYCSRECQSFDNPSITSSRDFADEDPASFIAILPPQCIDRPLRYTGRDTNGIVAWANQVPPSSYPPSPPSIRDSDSVCTRSSSSVSASLRPPKLLLPLRKALPPSLCMSTPKPTSPDPSSPIITPRRPAFDFLQDHVGGGSMTSLVTDSVATPSSAGQHVDGPSLVRKPSSLLAHIASQVRSWVGSGSNPKSKAPVVEPTIADVDDMPLSNDACRLVVENEFAVFSSPPVQFDWNVAVEKAIDLFDELDDNDSDDEYEHPVPRSYRSASPTPTPSRPPAGLPRSDYASSVLDVLVEELHPAFKTRGRQIVRCVS